jgi:eukaryotic-like serine/threonine-protein kinase
VSGHLPLGADDPVLVDGYRLLGRLGEGGQGRVYLAADAHGGRVALKVLLPELAADPVARARIAEQTDLTRHLPASVAVRVLAARADYDPPYVVTEYVPGPSLAARVRDDGPLRGAELEGLLVGTLAALVAVHAGGVVHHDLKPANILLGPHGPRFADFDLALRKGRRDPTANEEGVLGSAAFLAPERLDAGPAVSASDVFAWAATMVFAATGRSPFHAPDVDDVVHAVQHDPPDLAGAPAWVRPLLASCLAKDPGQRPTAEAARAQLEQARHPAPAWGSAPPVPHAPPARAGHRAPHPATRHAPLPGIRPTAPRRPPAWLSARRPPPAPTSARASGLTVVGYTIGAMGILGAVVVAAMIFFVALAIATAPPSDQTPTPTPTPDTSPGTSYSALGVPGPEAGAPSGP